MTIQATQKLNFFNNVRNASNSFSELRKTILSLGQTWNDRGYSTGIVDADFTGTEFEGLTAAQLALIISSFSAFDTWLNIGHDDNFSKITT